MIPLWPLLTVSLALADEPASEEESAPPAGGGPVIILTDEDALAEEAGVAPTGQSEASGTGLWNKSFLQGTDDKVILGGYVETEYHNDFHGQSKFDQHRMVLFVYARPHDRVSFATEIEWEHGGSPRKQDGQLTFGEVLLEFAVLDFKVAEWLNVRGGIVLVPIGNYNLTHDAPTQDLTVRPMVSSTLAPSTWFETGAGFFGDIPLGSHRLSYEIYAINGLDTKIYDGLGYRAARGSLGQDNNNNKGIVGRLAWEPVVGVEVGASGYRGAYDPGGQRWVTLAAVDWAARYKSLEVQGEAVRAWNDPGFDEGWAAATRDPIPEDLWGFYAQASLHFMPGFLRRAMPDDLREATFTGVVRYGEVDTDLAAVTSGDRSRLALGLNFRPIEAFVFKNELLLATHGGDEALARPWSGGWRPSPTYVGSLNLMF